MKSQQNIIELVTTRPATIALNNSYRSQTREKFVWYWLTLCLLGPWESWSQSVLIAWIPASSTWVCGGGRKVGIVVRSGDGVCKKMCWLQIFLELFWSNRNTRQNLSHKLGAHYTNGTKSLYTMHEYIVLTLLRQKKTFPPNKNVLVCLRSHHTYWFAYYTKDVLISCHCLLAV